MPKKRKPIRNGEALELSKSQILDKLAGEIHNIKIGGEAREVSTVELAMQKLRALAVMGDPRAVKLLEDLTPQLNQSAGGAYLVVPEPFRDDEEMKAALALHHRLIEEKTVNNPIATVKKLGANAAPAKAP